jgi:hypothetical protein
MTEKLIAKLEKPPISRRSCWAYPSRDRSSSSRRRSSSRLGIASRIYSGVTYAAVMPPSTVNVAPLT